MDEYTNILDEWMNMKGREVNVDQTKTHNQSNYENEYKLSG